MPADAAPSREAGNGPVAAVSRFLAAHGDAAMLVALGVAAFAVRVYGLTANPLWYDEVLTLERSNRDLAWLIQDSIAGRLPPTYFLLIWVAIKLFGGSAFVLRFPSALAGALAAPLAASIAGRIGGRWAGLAAGALVALVPNQVQSGQEARFYSIVACLVLVALWGLLRLLDAPPPKRGKPVAWDRPAWIAYGAGTAAALLTLADSLPWLIAANLAAGFGSARLGAGRRLFLQRWFAVQGGIVAAVAAMYLWVYANAPNLAPGIHTWWRPMFREFIPVCIDSTYLMRIVNSVDFDSLPTPVPGFGYAVAALAAFGAWRLRREPHRLALLGLAVIVLPLFLLAISGIRPSLLPRYLVWGTTPFLILAGLGAAGAPRRLQAAACALVVALAAANLFPYYGAETKPRWDLAAADIARQARPGDTILVEDLLYQPRMLTAGARAYGGLPAVDFTTDYIAALRALRTGHQLWVVYGRAIPGPLDPFRFFVVRMAPFGFPKAEYSEGRSIRVWLFRPGPARRP